MKLALCLSGYTGLKGKNISLTTGYNHFKKNFIQNHDVDVYVHSWSVDEKQEILDLYNPINYIIEKQKNEESGILNRVYSQWYSRKKVIDLVNPNIKYDWVMLTRFDIALKFKFNLENYNNKNIYLAGAPRPVAVNDIFFLSSYEHLKYLSNMFDNLKAEGYKTNNKNGGYPGGTHYTVGKYIRKQADIKILGTDVGPNKNCWFVRDL